MVHYVRDNFLNGRSFTDLADLNTQARHWLNYTSNVRLHATTERRPVDLWPLEKLTALKSVAPYSVVPQSARQAGFDSFVRFDQSRYSVPPEYAGQTVCVGREQSKIVIRCQDMIIAEHIPALKPRSIVADPAHLAALWKLSLQKTKVPPPRWQLTFDQPVESTSLATYQEVSQ